jgi:hypothetical protein
VSLEAATRSTAELAEALLGKEPGPERTGLMTEYANAVAREADAVVEPPPHDDEDAPPGTTGAKAILPLPPYRDRKAAAETKLPWLSPTDLAATSGPLAWLILGWILPQAVLLLSAKPKVGKTTLLMHLVGALCRGTSFLGAPPCTPTKVLYLSEERRPSLRQQIERAGLMDVENLHLLAWNTVASIPWPDLVTKLIAHAKEIGAQVLIVDTFHQFSGLTEDKENSAGYTLEALRPLQLAAAAGLAVIVVTHDRKSGGGTGDSTRGSNALPGAVDIIANMTLGDGESERVRVLSTLSRFDETPSKSVIELTETGGYILKGNVSEARIAATEAVLAILPSSEPLAISLKELEERTDLRRTMLQEVVDFLSKSRRDFAFKGTGKKGDPKRFWIVPPSVKQAQQQTLEVAGRNAAARTNLLGTAESGRNENGGIS